MNKEESIFNRALELPADERPAFIEKSCDGDAGLMARVEALLSAHDRTYSFIDQVVQNESSQDDDATDSLIGRSVGKFKLLQKIGEGGFGVVYMAEQREPMVRKVAIKIVKPGMDSNAVIARFEAERQALAILDHPNIAKVFDGGSTGLGDREANRPQTVSSQRPYFVMELVSGIPVTDYCDQNNLSTTDRLQLFVDICKAVQHAHQKGIIHRDLKPSNVMVTLHDGQPVVKVIDFGVAKALNQKLTEKTMFTNYGQMIGTPQYMSPEQAEMSGLDIDTRSDIYSLAVLLYELLTGTTPLEANVIREAGYQKMQELICRSEPPKPSNRISTSGNKLTAIAKHRSVSPEKLRREVRGDLDWIVMKGLEKDRQRRYETPLQFAQDIQRALKNEPVLAGPPSVLYRTQKFLQRNPVSALMTSVLIVASIALTLLIIGNRNAYFEQVKTDSERLLQAVNEGSRMLGIASQSSFSSTAWVEAESAKQRVLDRIETSHADSSSRTAAQELLDAYQVAELDRDFSTKLENILVRRATLMDLESWKRMEQEIKAILKTWDLDVDQLSPDEVARRVAKHRANVRIADAIELWMGTRGQMAMMGGPKLTKSIMQPWADAMYVMDVDPLRMGIRKIIYQGLPATEENLSKLIEENDLQTASARTLSWLGSALMMGRQLEKAEEIMQFALRKFPDDLMLNFDHAYMLVAQNKWNESIRYYMRCLALRPRNAGCWHGVGIAYRENGELKKSIDALKYSAEIDSRVASTWIELAKSQLAADDAVGCIESAKRGLNINANYVVGWSMIGQAHMKQERYQEALVAFEKCKATDSTSKPAPDVSKFIEACRNKIKDQNKN